ncbi:hypothetical protein EBZ02_03540 [bacterium]|nr:hypothetical protein [bacterium]
MSGVKFTWGGLWRIVLVWGGTDVLTLAEDDPAGLVYWVQPRDVISKSDLDLEKSMKEKGYYWVNGQWTRKGEPIFAARNAGEVKDSDGDGFDDFTEIKFHTDPFNPESTPAAYFDAKGSNRVVFYGTNKTAQRK